MQAFSNIRVIDLTHVIAGPFCTYQLAVMGADVIKVEPPDNPDMSRATNSSLSEGRVGLGAFFTSQNANKRAICIDLKTASGRGILGRLITTADVVVENYRTGAMAKAGLDYARVKAIKPDIIYCSMTGFGQDGPNAERTAYDNVIQAYSGLMAATGDPCSAPVKVGPPVLDYGTGIQAAFAIAAALYQRTFTGKGQYIDIAMLDSAIMLMSTNVTYYHQTGKLSPVAGNNSTTNAGYCCYRTGSALLMLGAFTGTQVRNMWVVLGDPDHGEQMEKVSAQDMVNHFEHDTARIAKILMEKPAEQWEVEFNDKKVPAARVRQLDETLADPQLQSRTVLQPVPGDPASQKLPVASFKYAEGGPALNRPPPVLAEHTREILMEAGYTGSELERLHNQGIIKIASPEV